MRNGTVWRFMPNTFMEGCPRCRYGLLHIMRELRDVRRQRGAWNGRHISLDIRCNMIDIGRRGFTLPMSSLSIISQHGADTSPGKLCAPHGVVSHTARAENALLNAKCFDNWISCRVHDPAAPLLTIYVERRTVQGHHEPEID
eukprot:IDg13650t1